MNQTNFEKVVEFNKAFGVINNTEPNHKIFNDINKKLVEYRLSLVVEEVNELKDAIMNKDIVETVDALADITYVVHGFFTALGVNADNAFDIVHKSNMSKLCVSEAEAIATVESYKKDDRYDTPAYKPADDNINWVVYNKSTMKVLKSINYIPADFKSLL